MNRLPLGAIVLLVGLANIAPADDKLIKGDLARLQGTWVGRTGQDGRFQTTVTIKENLCSFDNATDSGSKIGGTSSIVIDELAKPYKTIDANIISRYGGGGGGAPNHVFGIYEFIDANTIRICNGFDRRPTDFQGGASQSFMVFTLKRERDEDKAKKPGSPAMAQPPALPERRRPSRCGISGSSRAALTQVLLGLPAVEQELKLTDAQKKERAEINERRFQKMQEARKEMQDRAKFVARRDAIWSEAAAAQLANLKPEQRERLIQIQLQAQGPLAFTLREDHESSRTGDYIGPRLSEQLKMTDDQVKRVRMIAKEGIAQIEKSAQFRIPLDSNDKPTEETIRKLVEGPEFQAAKEKSRRAAREAWDAVIGRIEAVLKQEQRGKYRKILGTPFDLKKLEFMQHDAEINSDVRKVARALDAGNVIADLGGQGADLNFDVKLARPMFTHVRPTVAIDQAHNNFHTMDGRYKPFADLMRNDGFVVSPNTEVLRNGPRITSPFTFDMLSIPLLRVQHQGGTHGRVCTRNRAGDEAVVRLAGREGSSKVCSRRGHEVGSRWGRVCGASVGLRPQDHPPRTIGIGGD